MKAKATVGLRLSSEKQLTTLLDALAPEANRPVNTRARAVLKREGNFLVLKVEAKDTVPLRDCLSVLRVDDDGHEGTIVTWEIYFNARRTPSGLFAGLGLRGAVRRSLRNLTKAFGGELV